MSGLRVDDTPYDEFLAVLLVQIGGLGATRRTIMSNLWDHWRSDAGYQLLNAVYSANRRNPDTDVQYPPQLASDASEVIAWKAEGSNKRPEWLHSISDAELAAL